MFLFHVNKTNVFFSTTCLSVLFHELSLCESLELCGCHPPLCMLLPWLIPKVIMHAAFYFLTFHSLNCNCTPARHYTPSHLGSIQIISEHLIFKLKALHLLVLFSSAYICFVCPCVDLSVLPPPLVMTGCFVSLLLPASENRRNKLQGIMSDFPSKPSPPPSISGQARSGEGKTCTFNMRL